MTYRDPATILVVPDGDPAPVLAAFVARGWRVVGREGAGYVLAKAPGPEDHPRARAPRSYGRGR